MPSKNDIARLAAMTNLLRPDWPISSLITWLTNDHAHRTYQDLAVALAWIATDPDTKTPKRMNESGPWWQAVTVAVNATQRMSNSGPPRPEDACPIDGHGSFLAHNCGACRGEQLGKPREPEPPDEEQAAINREGRELVRQAAHNPPAA